MQKKKMDKRNAKMLIDQEKKRSQKLKNFDEGVQR